MSTHLIVPAIAALLLAGCAKDSSFPVALATTPSIVVSPGDGQTGVRLDAGVNLSFASPVDRAIVERDFHLISERNMADSLCPTSTAMNHGNMMTAMEDSTNMRHLDQIHSTRGRFLWNADSTECTFRPDSMMTSKTQYMIHLGQDMVGMMEARMGEMASMGGHGSGMTSREMILHFVTLDTATSGGGHGGHH